MRQLTRLFFYEKDIISEQNTIDFWRQRFFVLLNFTSLIGGLFMSGGGVIAFLSAGIVVGAIGNVLVYLVIAFTLTYKKNSFKVRKVLMSLVYYVLGIRLLLVVGSLSAWNLIILVAFISAGFLFSLDELKLYGCFNLIVFAVLSFLMELGYLDAFPMSNYGISWYVNIVSLQMIGSIVVIAVYYMMSGIAKQTEERLASERNLLATLNALEDGIIVLNQEGYINRANPYFYDHYNILEEEVLNKHINNVIFKVDAEEEHDFFAHLHANPECEMDVKLKGCLSKFFIQCSLAGITEFDGEVVGYVCIIHDMTEHKEEELKLRQTQKMEAIGTMAGGVAHDFNNMLGGILGYAELSREMIEPSQKKLIKYNDEIIKTSLKASELTKQLLAYARRKEMKREPIDMNQSVMNVVNMMERTFEKRVEIEVHSGVQLLKVFGDASLLENAVLNLGLNGRDAMISGGKLDISLGEVHLDDAYCKASNFKLTSGRYMHLRVKDNGEGMSQEVAERVFEPFFTTKEIGKGTGLGMAATYGTIVSHKGEITVKSVEHAGTEVDVYLPLYNEEEPDKQAVEAKVTEITHGGRLLVIDDEEVIRSMMKEILEMLGYEVDVASDGFSGIEIYERNRDAYRGVLVDMIMPKISGREVYTMIKAVNPEAKVLMISGFTDENHVDELYALGLDAFVKKPFTIESIVEALSVL